jgi:hypothetical protein
MEQPVPTMTGCIPSHLPAELYEFVSADFPPQDEKPVLCIRPACCRHAKYELLTACYLPSKRSWRTLDGAWLVGPPILGWKNAHRWLQPAN